MPVTPAQKAAIEEVINIIATAKPPRGKRLLAQEFFDLVDREDYPEYFEIIPEPRAINNIRSSVKSDRYKEPLDAYTDLSLVFWNALYYNEPGSQIADDAEMLKTITETEWKRRTILPIPLRTSPPPSSPQKVHKATEEKPDEEERKQKLQSAPPPVPISVPAPAPPPVLQIIPVTQPAPARTVIPAPQHPVPSTSTIAPPRPTPAQPTRSTRLHPSPQAEIDVDISGMSSDGGYDPATKASAELRDAASEEIVKHLEKSLPQWPGFGDEGWMDDVDPSRLTELVHIIKSHKDVIGNRLATALESVPEQVNIANLSYNEPLSLKLIETRVRANQYPDAHTFDLDMARLFEKARRWHEPCTEPYGRVLLLQRLYQALTSANPPSGPSYASSTNFASLRAGPGVAPPVDGEAEGAPGVTSSRVITKDRRSIEAVKYKGWSVKLGDWVHLSNPDDPSRPIVAQVFRCWVSEEESKKGEIGLSVSWYFRPEQTFHSADRKFWEGEVFKTNHFADHALEDFIEKVACQSLTRHVLGRPRPPYWYPGFPLYTCDSRYDDRERVFAKIENWNLCIPEELRQSAEFMPIYPFERTVSLSRYPSPFLGRGGKKGPGGVLPNDSRRNGNGVTFDMGAGRAGNITTTAAHGYQPYGVAIPQQSAKPAVDRSVLTAAGGPGLGNNAHVEKLPPETAKHFDRDPDTNEVLWFPAPPVNVARPSTPKHSLAYLHFLASKRKQESAGGDSDHAMDIDADSIRPDKRPRVYVPPTVSETLRAVFSDVSV